MKVAVLSFARECATTYVRLLRDLPGVDVITADPDDPTRGRALAARLGVPFVGGWEEVFALCPDAVVVTSERGRQWELVERAARIGAHVLCEHPLTTSAMEVEALFERGARLTLASPTCFSPAFAAVRRAITDGTAVGRLMAIHGAHNGSRSLGGALAAHAPVLLDLVDLVLDGEPAEQVYAQVNSILSGRPEVESAALLSVRYASGTVAAFDCSWGLSSIPQTPTVTFVGDRGSVDLNHPPRLLKGFDAATGSEWWENGGVDASEVMLREFVTAVGQERDAGPDAATAVRVSGIIQAAVESVRIGAPVDLVESARGFARIGSTDS